MFDRIKKKKLSVMEKVVALSGDVTVDNLGLSVEQLLVLKEEVNIVFHCAATLKLEANLKDAVLMNTVSNIIKNKFIMVNCYT